MLIDENKAVIRKQIDSVQFGFYTDEDVRKRSVLEITNPITFDNLNNALAGGLCDPRLGPSHFNEGPCPTCSLREADCPGHFGHIELAVPVHHPLLVHEILNILKIKCLACHKLKAPPQALAEIKAKFNLLNQGKTERLLQFQTEKAVVMKVEGSDQSPRKPSKQSTVESARRLDSFLATLQPTEEQYANWKSRKLSAFEQDIQRKLVKECFDACKAAKYCAHCLGCSPAVRQDSGNKFFQKPLSKTMQKRNMENGIRIESALKSDGDFGSSSAHVSNRESEADDMSVGSDEEEGPKSKDNYMHASEVQAQLKRTWKSDPFLMNCLYGPGTSFDVDGCKHFFLQAISVPPNRFRPIMETNGAKVQHSQNQYLSKIMQFNQQIRDFFASDQEPRAYSAWIELQTNVNCFMDSSLDPSATPSNLVAPGIRQLLERKEGLFRKNMMGKRVNYACRSVISPDPYVGANEIGLPLYFASTLTFPTPVTQLNEKEMRHLVERGAEYPGARWVEVEGRRMDLTKMKKDARASVAKLLLSQLKSGGKPAVVGRQLVDGDYVLMNRQPTLHKPGIMAHRVRVLHNPTQKTIRMHYSNCDTYNADFDGDEMNCHFPQSDLARAEAKYIARTDLQYTAPTDGSPLRGLIQDHVVGGVKLTKQDTFLEKWEYQQLLFACLASLPGLEVIRSDAEIELVPPAVIKPRELWTGKQVITTVLRHLQKGSDQDTKTTSDFPGISVEKKAKTPGVTFGKKNEEHLVIIRDGELLRGVLDKAAFGATDFSLVHAVHDAYGPEKAGIFLNALSRLFTAYVQYFAGHSCRTEDLILTKDADEKRRQLVQRAYNLGTRAAKAWADSEGGKVPIPPVSDNEYSEPLKPFELAEASAKIGDLLSGREGPDNFAALDGYMQGQLNPLASDIVKASLPDGLVVQFPYNSFGIMTTTGAKGSIVNQSQVICSLGQQALEGRRVPRLSSGRTLPSFAPYDPRPRADGFVMDRFLTGVRPQEYYFHCMAGREGLVDTAVKTSRSGYLQRCLVKHLEELKICYDFTVRNAEGGVVQFLYGEDGLDPTKAPYLDCTEKSLAFLARNHDSVVRQCTGLPDSGLDMAAADASSYKAVMENADNPRNLMKPGLRVKARRLREGHEWKRGALCHGWFDAIVTAVYDGEVVDIQYMKDHTQAKRVPVECHLGWCGGSTTEAASSIATLVKPAAFDPLTCTVDRGHRLGSSGACISERVAGLSYEEMNNNKRLQQIMESKDVTPEKLGQLIAAKYSSSLCAPGEAVGSIAAQSIGEPSTQMTLNTFHLAGSGANVTLGIPRLREIIMTASRELKTPTMSVPLRPSVDEASAIKLTRTFKRLTLMELIAGHRGITVTERLDRIETGEWKRHYYVKIKLHPAERIRAAFGVSLESVARVVGTDLAPVLARIMGMELKRSATKDELGLISVDGGKSSDFVEGKRFDDEDDNAKDENAKLASAMDDLGDNDDEEDIDDDEMGEEDGVRRNRSQSVSYDDDDEVMDDDGDSETGRDEFVGQESQPSGGPQTSPEEEQDYESELKAWKDSQSITVDKKANTINMIPLKLDPATRPLLMVQLVEKAAEKTVVLCRSKIDEAYVNDEEGRGKCLQTAGVNFEEIWKLDEKEVDQNGLLSNDIWQIRTAYGVEAARNTIVQQITSVFGVYGIEVDARHLSLIADYMTYEGDYKPMSRNGMKQNSSAFLQMSFETTANFLKQAAMIQDKDTMSSPSANIVVGRPIKHGSGLLEVLAA